MTIKKTSTYPPGPNGLPVIGVLHKMRRPIPFFTQVSRQYGDVVRLNFGSRDALLLNEPGYVKHILQENYGNYHKGVDGNQVADRILGKGLTTSEGAYWLRQRRLIQPTFHRRHIITMVTVMTDEIEKLIERWDKAANRSETLDMLAEMMHLTLNITIKTMFGSEVATDVDVDVAQISQAWTTVLRYLNDRAFSLIHVPETWPTPANRRFEEALHLLEGVVAVLIEKRRADGGGSDLLSMLLALQDEETGVGLTDKEVRDEVMTVFLAGHETTAALLAWTWHLLDQNPDKLRQLRIELALCLNGRTPTAADLPKLSYTGMVIEEALRLYPPFWLAYRTAYEEDEIGGYDIAPGQMILINTYGIHRDPAYWDDPDAFEPERFTPENKKKQPAFAYFPFGGGPRQCIGNNFALMEAQLVLAMLAQRYDMQTVPEHRVALEALVTLRPKGGLPMIIRHRT